MAIGERIKSARKVQGCSLRTLAEQIGLSHNAISKYERNEVVPGSKILIALADVLEVPVDYFFRQASVKLGAPQFRLKHKQLPSREEKRILATVQDWLERYHEIELISEAGKPGNFSFPKGFPMKVISFEEVEKAANKLREKWNLGLDAIDNMVSLLEDKGIKIYHIEHASEFDAAIVPSSDNEYVFVINTHKFTSDHQRYSLAHELGHLMLKIPDDCDEEAFAHRFAAAFIVPKQTALDQLGKNRGKLNISELHLLKHKFGLSMQAWIKRAAELKIISDSYKSQLLKLFKDRDWRNREPGDHYSHEEPSRMKRLIYKALAEGLITESRAYEILGIQVDKSMEISTP